MFNTVRSPRSKTTESLLDSPLALPSVTLGSTHLWLLKTHPTPHWGVLWTNRYQCVPMILYHRHAGRALTCGSLCWLHKYSPALIGLGTCSADARKMVPQLSNMDHTEEEQDNTWVLVGEEEYFRKRRPQLEEYNFSPTKNSAGAISDEALPDLACKPTHTICWPPTIEGVLHRTKASDLNPTPDPKVESVESTATGLTFSTPEDVSSDPLPRTHAEDDSQLQPLTRANLGPNSTPRLIRDIQAWINGELSWLRVAVGGDQASVVPFARGTTCHGSAGSLDFVFIPAQPSSFGRDALGLGTLFEHLPYTQTYSLDMELDEA